MNTVTNKSVSIVPAKMDLFGTEIEPIEISKKFKDSITPEGVYNAVMSVKNNPELFRPNKLGQYQYVEYEYEQFLALFISYIRERNTPLYMKIHAFEMSKLYEFGIKNMIPIVLFIRDITTNVCIRENKTSGSDIVSRKLYIDTGKVADAILRMRGYRYVTKTSPVDKCRCSIWFRPPVGKKFVGLPENSRRVHRNCHTCRSFRI